ncbi:NUDIX domain-containing protein [Allorhizobium sp. BGMRC 0089]|uniref:NUDIX domain-containing protein n=1 Tax=Allorhizobium sonneratiae TaxID=2934936 RepID=UPI002033CD48|nr:NUDIX domain-containing protein [Allorhizobium sonneratiae]MCM2292997.1 NUDIX domain-containing protein [Allorhizobium sonneratiae]
MLPGTDFPGLGVNLIINRGGKTLLYKRVKPLEADHWSFVGGKIDLMEPAEAAARREAQEETGLIIGQMQFLTVLERIHPENNQHWLLMIYKSEDICGDPKLMEPDKLSDFGWFASDSLPEPLSAVVKAALPFLG